MRETNLYPPSPLTDDKNQDFSVIQQLLAQCAKVSKKITALCKNALCKVHIID